MKVNRIFGILSCGVVNEDHISGRYSTESAGKETANKLNEILSSDPETRGYQIEFLIWLMRSQPVWAKLINKFDPENSYDTLIDIKTDIKLSIKQLYDWAMGLPNIENEFAWRTTGDDITTDLIISRLIGLITTNN